MRTVRLGLLASLANYFCISISIKASCMGMCIHNTYIQLAETWSHQSMEELEMREREPESMYCTMCELGMAFECWLLVFKEYYTECICIENEKFLVRNIGMV